MKDASANFCELKGQLRIIANRKIWRIAEKPVSLHYDLRIAHRTGGLRVAVRSDGAEQPPQGDGHAGAPRQGARAAGTAAGTERTEHRPERGKDHGAGVAAEEAGRRKLAAAAGAGGEEGHAYI